MFRKTSIVIVVFVLATLLAGCMAVQAGPQAEEQVVPAPALAQMERDITVVGIGRVNLVPNVAKINVGAEFRAITVSEAKNKVDRQMEAIAAALEELGITDKDIQSSQYSIFYEQEP